MAVQRALEHWAGAVSVWAGLLHFWAGPEHAAQWWAYGLFFYGAAIIQACYGLLLFTQGIEGWGGWEAVRGRVYGLGIFGNLAIIGLWVVTRTLGVPLGPEAGDVEGVGPLDLTSKIAETALILLLVWLTMLDRRARQASAPPTGVGP